GYDPTDLAPDTLWRLLKLYIKQKGVPIILDIDPTSQVWNYPVYAYSVNYSPAGGNFYRGLMALYMADDKVDPHYVGTKVKKRTYTFVCRMHNGSIQPGSSRWVGRSVSDHPDFAWYPYVVKPKNPRLSYAVVRSMLGIGQRHA